MKRILILGCSGAGKSTLARQLGYLTHLPVTHIDAVVWKPGWVMMDRDEEVVRLQKLIEQPGWIIDGNYLSTGGPRLAAADTIIFLDFPRWLCLWRVIKRVITYYGRVRPDMGQGCPERWDWDFLHWIWTFKQHQQPLILEKIAQYQRGRTVFIFRKPADIKQFLNQFLPAPGFQERGRGGRPLS